MDVDIPMGSYSDHIQALAEEMANKILGLG